MIGTTKTAEPALLYITEWQAGASTGAAVKSVNKRTITWELGKAPATRIIKQALYHGDAASPALRSLQVLQTRQPQETVGLRLPIASLLVRSQSSTYSAAAMLKVAASENRDAHFSMIHEEANASGSSKAAFSDAFGRIHDAGVQFLPRLIPDSPASTKPQLPCGDQQKGRVIVSGGLGGKSFAHIESF